MYFYAVSTLPIERKQLPHCGRIIRVAENVIGFVNRQFDRIFPKQFYKLLVVQNAQIRKNDV